MEVSAQKQQLTPVKKPFLQKLKKIAPYILSFLAVTLIHYPYRGFTLGMGYPLGEFIQNNISLFLSTTIFSIIAVVTIFWVWRVQSWVKYWVLLLLILLGFFIEFFIFFSFTWYLDFFVLRVGEEKFCEQGWKKDRENVGNDVVSSIDRLSQNATIYCTEIAKLKNGDEKILVSPTPPISPTPSPKIQSVIPLSTAWNETTEYINPELGISFRYPSYFLVNVTDIDKANKEWAQTYKNNPTVKQPLYTSSFSATFNSHGPETRATQEVCDNKMTVSISQYKNNENLSLYDFIAKQNITYPGNGITETFGTYKKYLSKTTIPFPDSYMFVGNKGENPIKEVYFSTKGTVYRFYLIGNCDTGGQYTKDADMVFQKMLESVKQL